MSEPEITHPATKKSARPGSTEVWTKPAESYVVTYSLEINALYFSAVQNFPENYVASETSRSQLSETLVCSGAAAWVCVSSLRTDRTLCPLRYSLFCERTVRKCSWTMFISLALETKFAFPSHWCNVHCGQ